jgi:membrane-bound ClpP family serine protease
MNLPTNDILKVAAEWCVITATTLGWIHLSQQKRVPRSFVNSLMISVRLAIVVVGSVAVLCVWLRMSVDLFLGLFTFVVVLFPLATVDFIPTADPVGFVINVLFFLPIYALKQFILGFPDREILIPAPEPFVPTSTDLTGLRGVVATVTATLKPFGKIEIQAIEYDAIAVGGQVLDRGTTVRVTDIRNSVLMVTELR